MVWTGRLLTKDSACCALMIFFLLLHEHCSYYFLIIELINSSNWQCFCIKALCQVPHRKHTIGNGQNSGGREALKSRGKGTRREALLGGDKIEWYQGVATLGRSPGSLWG